MASKFVCVASLLAAALAMLATPAVAASDCSPESRFCVDGDAIEARMKDIFFIHVPGRPDPKEYLYSGSCFIDNEVRTADGCIDGVVPPPTESCETGFWVEPRWTRLRDQGDGTPGPWTLEVGYTCPGDEDFPFTVEDFRRLPIEPSPLHFQPDSGWVYAGLETIAYTSEAAQGFVVPIRGLQFYVGAYPTEFEWDFGDGSVPLETSDPGLPWPNHTVSHTYLSKATVQPSLTTRWSGVFRESEFDPWAPIPGTGETVSAGGSITIHTARTRLVEDDLT